QPSKYSATQQQLESTMQEKNHMSPAPENEQWSKPYVAPQTQAHTAPPSMQPAQPAALPPMAGPASTLSATKQQKLDHLLQLYRADQITRQEYQRQRAKILSE